MTMGHEYMHGYFFTHNLFNLKNDGHDIINNWHADQAAAWGEGLKFNNNYYDPKYCGNTNTYSKYGFKVIYNLP